MGKEPNGFSGAMNLMYSLGFTSVTSAVSPYNVIMFSDATEWNPSPYSVISVPAVPNVGRMATNVVRF